MALKLRLALGHGFISATIQLTSTSVPILFLLGGDTRPLDVGTLTMIGALPYLLFGFHSGACSDRYGAGRVLLVASGFLMAMLLTATAASGTGAPRFWTFALVVFSVGTAGAFVVPAFSTLIARGFTREARAAAIVYSFRGKTAGDLIGVGAAGLIVMFLGTNTFVISSALIPLLILVLWPLLRLQNKGVESTAALSMYRSIREGFSCLARSPQIQQLFAVSICLNLGQSMIVPMLYPFLGQGLALPPSIVSIMFALPSVGMLIGTMSFSFIRTTVAPQIVISLSLGGMSAIWICIGMFRPESYVIVGMLFFLFGFFIAVMATLLEVIRMGIVPTDLQGRLASIGMLASRAVIPLGALIGGWSATRWNLWTPFLVGGSVMLGSTILFATFALRGSFALEQK